MPEAQTKYRIVRAGQDKTPIGNIETSNQFILQKIVIQLNKRNPLRQYSVERVRKDAA